MKKFTKLVAVFLAALMVLGCLAGVTAFAADAEASWTDGTTTVEGTLAEMAKQASSKGGTVTLLKDVTFNGEKGYAVSSNSSFTMDLNGKTLTSSVGGVSITTSKGTVGVFTVKNGTIIARDIAISCNKGGLVVDGVTAVTEKKQSIIYNETSGTYNKDNLIQNSTFHCSAWGILSFNNTKEDQSAAAMTVKNSTLVSTKSNLFVRQKAAGSPTVLLGEGMKMYTVASAAVDKNLIAAGEAVTKADGTHSITVAGVTTEGLNLFTTPEKATVSLEVPTAPAAPATPATPAAAEVSWTDGKTVVEGTLAEIAKIANDKGGTVKLLADVNATGDASFAFNSKKSVVFDLNGKTLTTEKGAIRINKGADGVTVIKNGTIVSGTRTVSVVTGGLHLDGVTLWSNTTQCIDYYEASDKFNHQNIIENSTIGTPIWVCFSFNSTDANQEKASITVKNSTLIAAKGKGDAAFGLQTKPEGSTANVVVGEGVKIYNYSKNPVNAAIAQLGETLTKTEGEKSVTILDKTYDLMVEWTSPATATVDLSTVIPGPKPAEKPAEPATPATPAEPATPSTPAETEKKEEDKAPTTSAPAASATFVDETESAGGSMGLIIGIVAAVVVIAVVAVVVLKKKKQ